MTRLLAFGAGILLAVFASQPVADLVIETVEEHVCWRAEVKQEAHTLAQAQALALFRASLPADMSGQERGKAADSFRLTLDHFFAKSVSPSALEAHCGAGVHITYQRPDGSTVADVPGHVVNFAVYPGESGSIPVLSSLDVASLDLSYRPN